VPFTTAIAWTAPPIDAVKLNVDGSWVEVLNRMRGGGIIKDDYGIWLSGFSCNADGGNALHVELLAMEVGLRHAWELGYKDIHCEFDCTEVVNLLSNNTDVQFHWLRDIIMRIRSMLEWNWIVTVTSVNREFNQVDDALAKQGVQYGLPLRIWKFPPSRILSLLCRDLIV